MSDKINTFRNYNELTKAEQEQVDSMLESRCLNFHDSSLFEFA